MLPSLCWLSVAVGAVTADATITDATPRHLRGVDPSVHGRYAAAEFQCGQQRLPRAAINDNYCDCDDGSDEPGTAACAHLSTHALFHCANAGHLPSKLRSSRVGDGICDYDECCDGTDEWQRADVACPSQCTTVHQAYVAREQAARALRDAGATKRQQMVEHGQKLRGERVEKLAELRQRLTALQARLGPLLAEKDAAAQRETAAKDHAKSSPAKSDYCARAAAAENMLATLRDRLQFIDRILSAKSHRRHATDDDDDEESKHQHVEDDEDEIHEQAMMARHATGDPLERIRTTWSTIDLKALAALVPDQNLEAESSTPSTEDNESAPSWKAKLGQFYDKCGRPIIGWVKGLVVQLEPVQEVDVAIRDATLAREAWKSVDQEKSAVETEITAMEAKVARDYGKEQEFAELEGQCFDVDTGEYVYEICPFGSAHQKQSGRTIADLGEWHEWTAEDRYKVMRFTGGAQCWNGPARSAIVQMTCGAENRVMSVSEPNKCEYHIEFVTPAVCPKLAHQQKSPRDEL